MICKGLFYHFSMKHILAPIFLLVFLFPSLATGEEVTFDDLVIREGVWYKQFTDAPFTGNITGRNQGRFKNGVMEGPWVSYHDNGQLESKGTYKDGKKDGPWVGYYDNGQLQFKGTLKDGKEDGSWESYDKNGQSDEFAGTYKNGVKVD